VYFHETSEDGFRVLDENRNAVATARVEADAREIVAALNLVGGLLERFPGLAGDREVDGADLVGFLNGQLAVDEEGRFHEPDDSPDAVVTAAPPDKLVCPKCGNDGSGDHEFSYVEDSELYRKVEGIEGSRLIVHGYYQVCDEATANPRLVCTKCGKQFPVPPGLEEDFTMDD
jgi:ribosomal protein S27AE